MKIVSLIPLALLIGVPALSPAASAAQTQTDTRLRVPVGDSQQGGGENVPKAGQAYVGLWQGTLALPGASLRIVVDIQPAKAANAKPAGEKTAFTANLFSPDQTPKPFPADSVDIQGDTVRLEIKSLSARFEGKANAARTEIVGTFHQGGDLPLSLKKVDKVQPAEAPRPKPQEPARPYPYDEEEVKYDNKQQNVTLAGTLTLPRAKSPFPAVLLITGSGPQDRDEALLGHKPFLILSDYLTRRGIAVLRVDDRGVGKSTGNFGAATTADFATDVLAGVAYLKTRKEINPAQIGLAGHSEGGVLAPLVASQSPDVAFIVMMAGTGVPGDQILLLQAELMSRAEGGSPEAIAHNRDIQKQMFAALRAELDDAARTKKLRAIVQASLTQLSDAEKKQIGDTDAFVTAQVQSVESPWMRYFLTYDPRPALRKVTCPVLAINGSNDLQVPPTQNLPEIAAALSAGGNKDYTITELPGLNHLFQTSKTGAFSEYAKSEETISPLALRTIGDWIVQHTQSAPKP